MDDVDVLVPPADAHRAVDVLLGAGWAPEYLQPHRRIAVHHSQGFEHPDDGTVDLHWHTLNESSDDAGIWHAAVPVVVGGVDTLAPAPSDQLLLVCVHARPRVPDPPVRWVAESLTVLRGGGVEWERVVATARAGRVTLPLAEALAYLSERFDAPGARHRRGRPRTGAHLSPRAARPPRIDAADRPQRAAR